MIKYGYARFYLCDACLCGHSESWCWNCGAWLGSERERERVTLAYDGTLYGVVTAAQATAGALPPELTVRDLLDG